MGPLLDGMRLVGFDLDGTLIDSAPDLAAALNRLLESRGRSPLPLERVRALIGDGMEQLVSRALDESAAPGALEGAAAVAPLAPAQAEFRDLYRGRLFNHSRVYPGVREALAQLARGGWRCCCITNKETSLAEALLQAAGLDRWLEFCLGPQLPQERKPAPDLLHKGAVRAGVSVRELLYVGDSRNDLLAARAAGCRIGLVTYGYRQGIELAELHPDALIDDLRELLAQRAQ